MYGELDVLLGWAPDPVLGHAEVVPGVVSGQAYSFMGSIPLGAIPLVAIP